MTSTIQKSYEASTFRNHRGAIPDVDVQYSVTASDSVVFKILCYFIKLREKEMTHDYSNIRYSSGYSGAA